MAKVKYYAKENTKLGTHSFYAVPVPNGTLTFNELCEEACRNTSIEPSIMKAAVSEYMKTVQSNVLKGFRVPVGEQFITVYPNLNVSVKDTKNQDGTVKEVATAKMVTANKGKSRLGASVAVKFSQEFASQVSWQKIDERTGAVVEDEDITDGDDTNGGENTGGGSSSGSGSGGSQSKTVAAPSINGNTSFAESTQVTMSGPEGAEIHYTTDGSVPTSESNLYSEALFIV